ncbi:MAG: transglutaminase domain-containing protein [Lachnospiraceae bacterium]|nr:transglutaminase domain-containing protein [Lachnospiraceae bacterium]
MLNLHSETMKYMCLFLAVVCLYTLIGCKEKAIEEGEINNITYEVTASEDIATVRPNEPLVLEPVAGGEVVYGNDTVSIDATNAAEGYIIIEYTGANEKVKMQLTGPDGVTYTYNLMSQSAVIPITSGNGSYSATIYENISGSQYSTLFTTDMDLTVTNAMGPYLYPNQYVNFNKDSAIVPKAKELAEGAKTDLEVVTAVYSFVVGNVTYDKEKFEAAEKTYLPNVDEVLSTKRGFCFDYSALMCSMLRSQQIPARMEIGYAGDVYHAWLSVYIDDKGWVSGIIEFNGTDWTLMDPTFAANTSNAKLKSFIGDGSNYVTKYVY